MKYRQIIAILSLATLLLLTACGQSAPSAPAAKPQDTGQAPTSNKEPIKVGMSGAMTGPYSEYGEGMRKAAEVAAKLWNDKGGINGRPIKLIWYDDQLKPDQAAVNVKKLIEEDKVVAILGPSGSGPMLATAPITQAKGIPQINIMAQTPAITYPDGLDKPPRPNMFSVGIHNDVEAQNLANFAITKSDKVGIIFESTGYGKTAAEEITRYLKAKKNLDVVDREQYDQREADMTAQLARLQRAGAGVLVSIGLGNDSATIRKNMNQLGFNAPLVGAAGVISATYLELAGSLAEGTYGSLLGKFADPTRLSPQAREFADTWFKLFGNDRFYGPGKDPQVYLAIQAAYYDGANLLFDAIRRASNPDAPQQIVAALNTTDWQGVITRHKFTATVHHSIRPEDLDVMVYKQVDGKLVLRPSGT